MMVFTETRLEDVFEVCIVHLRIQLTLSL
jgi:hypothetical protein